MKTSNLKERKARARALARIRRAKKIRKALEELDMDLNLDEILDDVESEKMEIKEVDENEFEPVDCPPGCLPAEKCEKADEEKEEEKEEEEEEMKKEEKEEEKEAKAEEGMDVETGVETEVNANTNDETVAAEHVATVVTRKVLADLSADDITLILHEAADSPHYVILAKGHPLGEIHRADMNLDEDMADMFVSDIFTNGLAESMVSMGPEAVFNDLPVRYYEDAISAAQAEDRGRQAALKDLEEAYQRKVAKIKDDMFDKVQLAFEASLKNVFLKNQLRDAFRQAGRQYGLNDAAAVELFETAMLTAGTDYFASLFRKADEWLGFEEEAMNQVEAAIHEAEYTHPIDRGLPIEDPEVPEAPVHVAAPMTLPERPAPMASHPEKKEAGVNEEVILRKYLAGLTRPH